MINEKIAICYSCAGESYRESAVRQLEQNYIDDDNLYYFIITDDKEYFKNVKRKNLIVNELKDFYSDFPLVEKYEALVDSTDKSDYAKKVMDTNYLYSFSIMRFHLLQAYNYGIKNVSLICTDTTFQLHKINDLILNNKNTIHNAVSEWDSNINTGNSHIIRDILKEKYNLVSDDVIRVLDAAGRFFIFDSLEKQIEFFNVWNEIILYLFENKLMHHFQGSYVYNDEYILAPIYNVFGLNKQYSHATSGLFDVRHNQVEERFWNLPSHPELQSHTDYNEFLRINNLQKNG